jgi:hypothetical protein
MHVQRDQTMAKAAAGWPALQRAARDGRSTALRLYLEAVRTRARTASSWLHSSGHYARLINRDGVVPLTARFRAEDLAFLAKAREELLCFAELGLRLADQHQPLDTWPAGGEPASLVQQCAGCGCRWPCPTFAVLDEVLADWQRLA